jgi:hypothetical protein
LFRATQSSTYANKYKASWPLDGLGFSHTNKGVNQWWKAEFESGDRIVTSVRILNRKSCTKCGKRLSGTKVMIGDKECGMLPSNTEKGKWYTINCRGGISGNSVKLITTRNDYLHIEGIEVQALPVKADE